MTEFDSASFQEAIGGETPVLVDFWAGWCMPCKILAPVVEEIADELDGQMDCGKVDIDQNQQLAAQYGIQSIPTLLLFKGGEPVERLVGVKKKDDILAALRAHL